MRPARQLGQCSNLRNLSATAAREAVYRATRRAGAEMMATRIWLRPSRKPSNAVEQISHVNEKIPRIVVRPIGEPVVAWSARRLNVSIWPASSFVGVPTLAP